MLTTYMIIKIADFYNSYCYYHQRKEYANLAFLDNYAKKMEALEDLIRKGRETCLELMRE